VNNEDLFCLTGVIPIYGISFVQFLSRSMSHSIHSGKASDGSLLLAAGQGEKRPHAVKRSTQNCDSSYDNYCLNDGQCMLLLDINEHHCKCERGFIGPRCDTPELVFQPMGEGQIIVIVFCVSLLIIGLAGALYLCCKWYKKNRFPRQPKRQGYTGVQTA
uniref:EGF-like domain-containing protein n=1 Tax=Amphilophus citrinellus TaxID=61819 RepID=A0A3Q0T419_AMPCI